MVILKEMTAHDGNRLQRTKSPESIARGYQLEYTDKAKEGNTIVCLETGCGKTLIAVMLLKQLSYLFPSSTPYIAVFLVPTVMLVQQQANVIGELSDLKVGQYNGQNDSGRWDLQKWEDDVHNMEVLVMTPQILLNILRHALIKMEAIKVLIFDECHHCQKGHPYARIMEEYYFKVDICARPRILGMTASPVIRKGKSEFQCSQDIDSLERLLDAKIITLEDRRELEAIVPSPTIEVREYSRVYDSFDRLESLVQTMHNLKPKQGMEQIGKSWERKKAAIDKISRDLEYCIFELGFWFARHAAKDVFCTDEYTLGERIEENGETNPNIDKDVFLRDIYQCLNQTILQGGYEDLEFDTLKPDHVSNKVVSLVNVLLNFRVSQLKCIVFVERVVAAKVLASFLCQLFKSMRCEYIVGSHSRMGHSSRQSMAKTLHDFRLGMVDVLVATNVAEEGLDIQDCCLVIQFDMPKTLRSYIQSRGRARVRASHYVVLKDRTNFLEDQLLETLIQSESFVKQKILSGHDMAVDPEEREEDFDFEMFRVESTGATVNIHYGVQLLHHFCSKLPSDQFYHPQPTFSYISEPNGIKCDILLPSNAPIRRVVGESCESETAAKKAACLKACRILHSKGALTDYLLPQTGMMVGDGDGDVSHHPHNFKETSAELQETIIPAVWLRKTTSSSSVMSLHAYMLSFIAVPDDREYINFALLLQSPLPEKAANICETLQLRHRRAVLCKLEPLRNIFLNQSEVTRAENFQSTLFSLLLDRNPEHSNPTELHMADGGWYLLLPLKSTQDLNTSQEQEIDWNKISKFTSARDSKHAVGMSDSVCASSSGASLQFANGNVDMEEVPGLLVKTIRGKDLYCIINIFTDRSADSPFPNDRYKTYVDYFKIMYNHEILHREQPLLKARFLREAHNFLQDRSSTKKDLSSNNAEEGSAELNKSLVELPPEICSIKFYGLHDDLVNSSVILPSFMHKLESILVATQLHDFFSAQFPEGSLVSVEKVLEAITTKKCMEDFSLERLELLGDSFLKYAVSRHLFLAHDEADEGFLSLQRIQRICNASLFTLGSNHGLPGFIRDGLFDPKHWVAPCHPSKAICDESKLVDLHGESSEIKEGKTFITCNKRHRWMQKKTVADVVEALIGAYLEDGGKQAALAFMKFIGVEISVDFLQISKIQYTSQNNLSLTTRIDSDALEKLLSYKFRHKGLLIEAFTHASFINHFGRCYQRLEFLGDSVLDYIITHYLYREYNESKPGQLTDMRSAIVSNESFARITVEHKLYVQLIYNSVELSRCINEFVCYICTSSENELLGDWDGDKCPKVLGDILESLAGAVFVDGGFDPDLVWKVFEPILQPVISRRNSQLHPVRELQELCQKNHFACTKDLSHNEGCTRCQFTIETLINNEVVLGAATAKDKKSAKRQAALDTLAKLKALGYVHPCKREAIGIEKRRDTDTMLVKEPSKVSKPRKIFWNPNTSMPHGPANLNSSHSVGISTDSKHEQERDAGVSNYQHINNKGYEDSGKEPASHSSEIKGGQTSAPSASSLGRPNAESKVKLGSVSQQSKMSPQDSVLQQRETGGLVNDTSLHYGDGSFLTEAKLIEKLCHTHLTSSGDSSSNKIDPADRRQNAGTFDKLVQAASKRHFLTHDLPTPREVHPHHPSMPLGDAFNNPDRMEGDDKQEPRKHGWFSCSTAFETGNRGPGSVLSGTPSHITSEYYLGQARADLHEACSRNRWKDPSFICSHEDGPPHDKRYTYDVILQLPSVGQVECTGDPRKNKKAAMESAAAELLSWLGSQGYM